MASRLSLLSAAAAWGVGSLRWSGEGGEESSFLRSFAASSSWSAGIPARKRPASLGSPAFLTASPIFALASSSAMRAWAA